MIDSLSVIVAREDTARVADLRRRVRAAMERPPVAWTCPARIDARHMDEPLQVRKARALALKLGAMSTELWEGQLFAGSMTLEDPRVHYERGFPDYTTAEERARVEAMPFVQAVCTAIGGRVIDVRMPGPESRRGEA